MAGARGGDQRQASIAVVSLDVDVLALSLVVA
jgi:hypothetical protein